MAADYTAAAGPGVGSKEGGLEAMARGWESKSVESQIDDAGSGADRSELATAGQRRLRQQRESLELSRRRVLHDLETAASPVRRASLEQALAFLDRQLADLE
jgi:hypothetical protein